MSPRFALVIVPLAASDERASYHDTFTVIDPVAAAVRVDDLAVQQGDGIFETLGVSHSHVQETEPHLTRLAHSAEICGLAAPNLEQWREAISLAAAHCASGEWSIKLTLSRGVEGGTTAWLTASAAPDFAGARTAGVSVVALDRGFTSGAAGGAPWLLLGAKTLSYATNLAAIREAKRRGADDAIYVSSDGVLLEAPTASLVLRIGDRFVTPAPGSGILHGTTQISVFDYLVRQGFEVGYDTLRLSDLMAANGAWLVSSVRLAAPIRAVDGVEVPLDHQLTDQLNSYLLSPRD